MAFAHVRLVPAYRSMELSIKCEGRPILYIEGFHKKYYIRSLEIEFVLEYSIDPSQKSFVQYFLWVSTVCHSPCLLQIDLNNVSQLYRSLKRLYHFDTPAHEKAATTIIPRPFGRTVTLCSFDQCLHCDLDSFKQF